jgi:hypothetical protein
MPRPDYVRIATGEPAKPGRALQVRVSLRQVQSMQVVIFDLEHDNNALIQPQTKTELCKWLGWCQSELHCTVLCRVRITATESATLGRALQVRVLLCGVLPML